ncbi:hypothetical protein FQA39_LY17484 [Lamprigera yunnana]|nr:hypothetical protein FQA39_LY17484 [Lamprigera yunnana]
MEKTTTEDLKEKQKSLIKKYETTDAEINRIKNMLCTLKSGNVSFLQNEMDSLKSKQDAIISYLRVKARDLEDQLKELNQKFKPQFSVYDQTICCSQKEIQHLEDLLNNRDITEDFSSHEESMWLSLEVIDIEVEYKQSLLLQMQKQNQDVVTSVNEITLQVEYLRGEDEQLEHELADDYSVLKEMEEEFWGEDLNFQKCDLKESKNSLFSEVNDHRVDLREKLSHIKKETDLLTEKMKFKQNQLIQYQYSYVQLQKLLKAHPIEYRKKFDEVLLVYSNYIRMMKIVYKEYDKILTEKQLLTSKPLPKNISDFLEKLFNDKRSTEQKLNDMISNESLFQTPTCMILREINLEIRKLEAEENMFLRNISESKQNIVQKQEDIKANIQKKNEFKLCPKNITDKPSVHKGGHNIQEVKKVEFCDSIPPQNEKSTLRKGGTLLQCKTIHFVRKRKN